MCMLAGLGRRMCRRTRATAHSSPPHSRLSGSTTASAARVPTATQPSIPCPACGPTTRHTVSPTAVPPTARAVLSSRSTACTRIPHQRTPRVPSQGLGICCSASAVHRHWVCHSSLVPLFGCPRIDLAADLQHCCASTAAVRSPGLQSAACSLQATCRAAHLLHWDSIIPVEAALRRLASASALLGHMAGCTLSCQSADMACRGRWEGTVMCALGKFVKAGLPWWHVSVSMVLSDIRSIRLSRASSRAVAFGTYTHVVGDRVAALWHASSVIACAGVLFCHQLYSC